MARYYCDYCHSYLTHDTLSVRKSHLIGKNHVRLTADYYYNKAIQNSAPFPFQKTKRGKRISRLSENCNTPSSSLVSYPKLYCEPNRLKRQRRIIHQIAASPTPLKQIYASSPGYHKVFTPECRLNVGDIIKVSRLPQRANQRPDQAAIQAPAPDTAVSAGRSKIYCPSYSVDAVLERELPPPLALAIWGSSAAKNSLVYHSDDSLRRTVAKIKSNITASCRSEKQYRGKHLNSECR